MGFFDQVTWFGTSPIFPTEYDTADPRLGKVKIIADSNVPNLQACPDGAVRYNSNFVNGIHSFVPNGRKDLFLYWILMHEFGHLVAKDGYGTSVGKNQGMEVRADLFALGTIATQAPELLADVAITVEGALGALNYPADATHPSNDVRRGYVKTALQTIAEQNAFSVRILDNDFVHEDFVKVIVQAMNTGLGSNLDATKVIQKMNTDKVVLIVVNNTWQTAMLVKRRIAELETLHQPHCCKPPQRRRLTNNCLCRCPCCACHCSRR